MGNMTEEITKLQTKNFTMISATVTVQMGALGYKTFQQNELYTHYFQIRGFSVPVRIPYPELYTGICNACRGVVLFDCKLTHLHHESYHGDNALEDTIELCPICHKFYEKERDDSRDEFMIPELEQNRSIKTEMILRLAQYYEELHFKGIYKEPLSHICHTICTELREKEMYSTTALVHKVLEPKYKQQKFSPHKFQNYQQ